MSEDKSTKPKETKENTQEGPKGIGFFSIKTGDHFYAKLEPQIQGFINSSDQGVNASRGQDFGWRIDPEWVHKIRKYREDEVKMSIIANNNGGQPPTDSQILYAIYGDEMRKYQRTLEESGNPFEEQYLQDIKPKSN